MALMAALSLDPLFFVLFFLREAKCEPNIDQTCGFFFFFFRE